MTDSKTEYSRLCEEEKDIPLFSRAWWLDATCGENNWDVVTVLNENTIVGSLPFYITTKNGFKKLTQPFLTQKLGPWIRKSSGPDFEQKNRQRKIINELYEKLPEYILYQQCWDHRIDDWLPLCDKEFTQSTRYTYILPDLSSINSVYENFRGNIKREINKATNRFHIEIVENGSFDDFYNVLCKTYDRQRMNAPHSKDQLYRLDQACLKHKARKIFLAVDPDGEIHAGLYLVWDDMTAYYIMGGGDPELRNSGATSSCFWSAIQFAGKKGLAFDFEGSMIVSIEKFFRAFGGTLTPYFHVQKRQKRLDVIMKRLGFKVS